MHVLTGIITGSGHILTLFSLKFVLLRPRRARRWHVCQPQVQPSAPLPLPLPHLYPFPALLPTSCRSLVVASGRRRPATHGDLASALEQRDSHFFTSATRIFFCKLIRANDLIQTKRLLVAFQEQLNGTASESPREAPFSNGGATRRSIWVAGGDWNLFVL